MNLVAGAFLVPLSCAVLVLFAGRHHRIRRALALLALLVQGAIALVLLIHTASGRRAVLTVGGWPVELSITLVVDLTGAAMMVLTAGILVLATLYDLAETPRRDEHPLKLPLVLLLGAGLNLAYATGDLFNLYVAVELVVIVSYGLLSLQADDRTISNTLPYVVINLAGATVFLATVALGYALFGTLNFAEIAQRADGLRGDPRLIFFATALVAVFGIKAALFPWFYWLPNSYPALPAPIGAIFAATLTKLGLYGLFRLFGTVLPPEVGGLNPLLVGLAVVTMLGGALVAAARSRVRDLIALLLVSHVGLPVVALGLGTSGSIAAGLFYLWHDALVQAALFLATGLLLRIRQTDAWGTAAHPAEPPRWLAGLFLITALSAAGFPPSSGFWGKLLIVNEAVAAGRPLIVAAVLLTSLLTLGALLRAWHGCFWAPAPAGPRRASARPRGWPGAVAAAGTLAMGSVAYGLAAEFPARLARQAAAQLCDRDGYVRAVLGESRAGAKPEEAAP